MHSARHQLSDNSSRRDNPSRLDVAGYRHCRSSHIAGDQVYFEQSEVKIADSLCEESEAQNMAENMVV